MCKKVEIKSKESSTVRKVRTKKRKHSDIERIMVEIVDVDFGDFD